MAGCILINNMDLIDYCLTKIPDSEAIFLKGLTNPNF